MIQLPGGMSLNCGAGFSACLFLNLPNGRLESLPHVTESSKFFRYLSITGGQTVITNAARHSPCVKVRNYFPP